MNLAQALRELLQFHQLGLVDTHFELLEPEVRPRARQYLGTVDVTSLHPSMDLWGGGGLISTTDELAAFFRALLQGRLFTKPGTLAAGLLMPDVRSADPTAPAHARLLRSHPFGRRLAWGHTGFWGVAALYCPEIDTAVAACMTQAPAALPVGILQALIQDVATLIG